MPKLYLNKPNRPKGEPTRVGHLGVFKNGGVYDVEGLEDDLHIPPKSQSPPVGTDTEGAAGSTENNTTPEETD